MNGSKAMNAAQTSKRTKRGGGRAFHSLLEPHVDFIREQRQKCRTWKEIAELLCIQMRCPITFQGVHQFYRRYVKRQVRANWERDATEHPTSPEPSRKTVLASTPRARPFKAPNPDSLNLNDPTNV